MRGCRPLTKEEALQVVAAFKGRNALRNRTLFKVQINTGFRISEILSVKIGDVLTRSGEIASTVTVSRDAMKGKHSGRTVLLNSHARAALGSYVLWKLATTDKYLMDDLTINPDCYLFASERDPAKPLDRVQAWKIYNRAYREASLEGNLGTHTPRKSFANWVHDDLTKRACLGEEIDPFRATSKALGHIDINSTDKYLSFKEELLHSTIEDVGI